MYIMIYIYIIIINYIYIYHFIVVSKLFFWRGTRFEVDVGRFTLTVRKGSRLLFPSGFSRRQSIAAAEIGSWFLVMLDM